jgi:hypothetical protein
MMTAFAAPYALMGDEYALSSPEARRVKQEVVIFGKPPGARGGSAIIRHVEIRREALENALAQLEAMRNLKEDWDSYGAVPIATGAISTARALFDELTYLSAPRFTPFNTAPIADGGVQVEWRQVDGKALELWISNSGKIKALIDDPSRAQRFEEKDIFDIAEAVLEVSAFVA